MVGGGRVWRAGRIRARWAGQAGGRAGRHYEPGGHIDRQTEPTKKQTERQTNTTNQLLTFYSQTQQNETRHLFSPTTQPTNDQTTHKREKNQSISQPSNNQQARQIESNDKQPTNQKIQINR
jgi:hypothetical protein